MATQVDLAPEVQPAPGQNILSNTVKYVMPDSSTVVAPANVPKQVVFARWKLSGLKADRDAFAESVKGVPLKVSDQLNPNDPNETYAKTTNQLASYDKAISDLESKIAKYKAENGGILDKAGYYAKNTAQSVLKGIASLPATVGDIIQGGSLGNNAPLPSAELSNLGHQPQTKGERRADFITQGASGAVVGPGGFTKPVKSALFGGAVGGGADLGLEASGENPLGALLGGLATGGLLSLPSLVKNTRESVAKEATAGLSEQDLLNAKAKQEEVAAGGLGTINTSQAMDKPSGIDSLIQTLANSRYGKKVQAQLNQQPLQASVAGEDALASVPGVVRTPQLNANNMQQATTERIQQGVKRAGEEYQKALPDDLTIDPKTLDQTVAQLEQYKKTLSPTEASMVSDVIDSFRVKAKEAGADKAILGLDGKPLNLPDTQTKYLSNANDLKKEMDFSLESFGQRRLNTSGNDANLNRIAQGIRNIVNTSAIDPILGKAKQAYGNVMEAEVNPLKQSEVGRIAGRSGYDDAHEAMTSKLQQIFDRGTDPLASRSEILELQKQLAKTENGNQVFQDSFKTWLSGRISKAVESDAGRTPTNAAANLTKIFGDPAKPSHSSQGMKDSLVALARSQGLPDNTLVNGMSHIQLFLSRASRRPGMVGDRSADLQALASGNADPRVVSSNPMAQGWAITRKIGEWRNADAYSFMDNLLTTPEGIDTLVKLSKEPALSPAALNTINTFLSLKATSDDKVQKLPYELPAD